MMIGAGSPHVRRLGLGDAARGKDVLSRWWRADERGPHPEWGGSVAVGGAARPGRVGSGDRQATAGVPQRGVRMATPVGVGGRSRRTRLHQGPAVSPDEGHRPDRPALLVRDTPRGASMLLYRMGFGPQTPAHRPAVHDEEAVRTRRRETWHRAKGQRSSVCVDLLRRRGGSHATAVEGTDPSAAWTDPGDSGAGQGIGPHPGRPAARARPGAEPVRRPHLLHRVKVHRAPQMRTPQLRRDRLHCPARRRTPIPQSRHRGHPGQSE